MAEFNGIMIFQKCHSRIKLRPQYFVPSGIFCHPFALFLPHPNFFWSVRNIFLVYPPGGTLKYPARAKNIGIEAEKLRRVVKISGWTGKILRGREKIEVRGVYFLTVHEMSPRKWN